jgi:hypothetical protein
MPAELLERRIPEYLTDPDWQPSGTTTTLPARAILSAGFKAHRTIKFPFPGGEFVVTITGTPPRWIVPTVQTLGELLSLPPNWDSYGAPRVDPSYVEAALRLALDVMRDDTPVPSVVPTSRGGVQLEWHTRGIDLEVEFVTPSQWHGLYEDQRTGAAWEADLTRDLKRLTDAIAALSR